MNVLESVQRARLTVDNIQPIPGRKIKKQLNKFLGDKGNLEIMIEVSNPILEGAFYPWQDSKRRIF